VTAARVVVAASPLALAIGVFGVIFGAASSAELGPEPTIAMSLFVFSGVVQFAIVGLLSSGAGVGAIIATVLALNARNLVLGAALRPLLSTTRLRRAILGWFLLDESFGLAITAGRQAAWVLAVSGAVCYVAWLAGTLLGVAGAQVVTLEDFASAIFPVLFVGLAAITARGDDAPLRVAGAVTIVLVVARLLPDVQPFLPIVAAILVAVPNGRGR
jgi:predicted branched-subunit amino acid permease